MPELPHLDVLIVAFGAPEDLARCLAALGSAHPVLVVDNSSSAEVAAVAERAGAAYRDSGANLGFAAAVNRGLDELGYGSGDVLLLNPDAEISPGDVATLQEALHRDDALACIAPAQRRPGSGTPVTVRWPFATPSGAWAEALGLGGRRKRWDFVIGSVLMLRGEAVSDVGRFDERFFLYGEEADWERRAVARGWRIGFCQDAEAVHAGAATDTDEARHRLRFHAGVELHVRKWHGRLGWQSYRLATVLTALRRSFRSGPATRRQSLRLAALYGRGPWASARKAGAVPAPSRHVPHN